VEWGCVGDDVIIGIIEDDVACTELLCASIFLLLVTSVLADTQQEIKGDG
jgi:hypothetical protein